MNALFEALPASGFGLSPAVALTFACLILALAGFVRGFAGFGSAMIAMPLLAALYGPRAAVPAMLLLEVIVSVPLLPRGKTQVQWGSVLLLAGAAFLTAPLGSLLLGSLSPNLLRNVISGAIILSALALALGLKREGPITRAGSALVGGASGILATLTGVGGPPVVLYFLSGPEPSATIRGSLIVAFFFMDLVAWGWTLAMGEASAGVALVAVLVLPFVAGGLVGQRVFRGASEGSYRWVALGIILGVAGGGWLL